jgi:hypothetical protein
MQKLSQKLSSMISFAVNVRLVTMNKNKKDKPLAGPIWLSRRLPSQIGYFDASVRANLLLHTNSLMYDVCYVRHVGSASLMCSMHESSICFEGKAVSADNQYQGHMGVCFRCGTIRWFSRRFLHKTLRWISIVQKPY